MPFKFLTKSQMKAKQLSDLCSLSARSAFACFGELIAHILFTSGKKEQSSSGPASTFALQNGERSKGD